MGRWSWHSLKDFKYQQCSLYLDIKKAAYCFKVIFASELDGSYLFNRLAIKDCILQYCKDRTDFLVQIWWCKRVVTDLFKSLICFFVAQWYIPQLHKGTVSLIGCQINVRHFSSKLALKKGYFYFWNICFLRCRIRIWSLFLAVASIFWVLKIMY